MLELVTVTTRDGVELDGAMYAPDRPRDAWRRPILAVHGLTWNFYRGPTRWLPPSFIEQGYPCLSLNMRDHDLEQPKDFGHSHHSQSGADDRWLARFAGCDGFRAHVGQPNFELLVVARQE